MVIKLSDLDEKNLIKLAKEKGIDKSEMTAHLLHVYQASEAGKRSNYCTNCCREIPQEITNGSVTAVSPCDDFQILAVPDESYPGRMRWL